MSEENETLALPLTLGGVGWAIRRDALNRVAALNHRVTPAWGSLLAAAPKAARQAPAQYAGGAVAILPLTGVITPRGSWISMLFGGGSGGLQGFRSDFREALNSPDVSAIVLDIDSPGGLIDLVPETAAEIRGARGEKPIIAVVNAMCCSAAYWIGAQADEMVSTPSGEAGSIGVYMLHEDWSGWNEREGIDPTYISAGKYKTEGNMDEPLSDEALAHFQSEVDDLYKMFIDDVAEGRGVAASEVLSNYGEGRSLLAARALAAGMIDRIAPIEDVIGELLLPSGSARGASALAGLDLTEAQNKRLLAILDEPEEEDDDDDEPEPVVEDEEPEAELDAESRAAISRARLGMRASA